MQHDSRAWAYPRDRPLTAHPPPYHSPDDVNRSVLRGDGIIFGETTSFAGDAGSFESAGTVTCGACANEWVGAGNNRAECYEVDMLPTPRPGNQTAPQTYSIGCLAPNHSDIPPTTFAT